MYIYNSKCSKAEKHWQKPKQSGQSMSPSLYQLQSDRSAKFILSEVRYC